ncbi:MAG TPA: recombinase family protein [Pirellulales bacterium]
MAQFEAGKIDCVVVCKVDRLSRSLPDFARMMEAIDRHGRPFGGFSRLYCGGK